MENMLIVFVANWIFTDGKLKLKWVRLTAFNSSQDKKGTTTGLCQSDSARLVPVKLLQG